MAETTQIIQMRSLNGDTLYPKTIVANVEGLSDELQALSTELIKEMNTLDEQVKEELSTKITNVHNDILAGENISIDGYTGWRNKAGVTYFTSNKEAKSTLTNLTIYKNIESDLIVVEGAVGSIVETINCNCGCDWCPPYYYDKYVLSISGTVTGIYFKDQLLGKKVISAKDTLYKNGNGLTLSETNVFDVKPFNGINVDENGVSVKLKEENSGLEVNENGLSVKSNDGLIINENGLNVRAGYGLKIDDGSFKEEEKGTLEVDGNEILNRERFENFVIDLVTKNIVSANLGTSDGLNILGTNEEDQYIMMTKYFNVTEPQDRTIKDFKLEYDNNTGKIKGTIILNNNNVLISEIDTPIEKSVQEETAPKKGFSLEDVDI